MAFGYPSETAAVFREDLDEIVQSRIFVEWIGKICAMVKIPIVR
jgi:hypothetical protein